MKSTLKTTYQGRILLWATSATLTLLTGCKSAPPEQAIAPLQHQEKFGQGTLADLENREIVINSGDLKNTTVADALGNYKAATHVLPQDSTRIDTLKRMADLTAKATEERDARMLDQSAGTPASAAPSAEVDKKISQNIDTMLYKSFMQGIATSKSKQEAAAYLDLASSVAGNVDVSKVRIDYDQAISLYKEVLRTSTNPQERQETYYKLARIYDVAGRTSDSITTLNQLAAEYPDSPFYVEAEFRAGEAYFSRNDFISAIESYKKVMAAPHPGKFYQQAEYKTGWSYYKSAEYNQAINTFFHVYEQLLQDRQTATATAPTGAHGDVSKLLTDTRRVISLCLIREDGPDTLGSWFDRHGDKPYEADIYQSLGQEYLLQNRFQDAASAFRAFVNRHPMDARAPEFSSATIRAYQNGGFPGLVLPAKESFVRSYGMNSAYWQQADAAKRKQLLPFLRNHLLDLAKHDHYLGQKNHDNAAYLSSVSWYRQYLATHPDQADAMANNELLGEALYAAGHYEEAITEFDKTAYGYTNNPQAVKAAVFELAAYSALLDAQKDSSSSSALWQRSVQASLHFTQTFPADPRTPEILADVTDSQLAHKDTQAAITTAEMLVHLQPPAPEKQSLQAWKVIADGQFDLGQADAAEVSYNKVLSYDSPLLSDADRKNYQERLAAAVYKQGAHWQAMHDTDQAVRAYMRVGDVVPQSPLHPLAEFDAATLLLNDGQFARAIPILESFRRQFPDHELNKTMAAKLGLAYEKTGNFPAAAIEFERIADQNVQSNPELARESLLHAADLSTQAHQPDKASQLYIKYVNTFKHPVTDLAEAENHLLQYYDKLQDADQTDHWLHALIDTNSQAGSESTARTRYLAAMATFRLAQPDFDAFKALTLNQPLNQSLPPKKAAMKKALDEYAQILTYGSAEYTTAANYQIAMLYHQLSTDLMSSERPAGLSGIELEQYNILLEEQADPFDDKAIHLLAANADLVRQGLYDDWVRKSFDALAKLSPGRYNRQEQLEPVVSAIY